METDKWEQVKIDHEDKLMDFIEEQEIEDRAISAFLLIQVVAELRTIRLILQENTDA